MEPIQSRFKVGDIVQTSFNKYTQGYKFRIIELNYIRDKSQFDRDESSRNQWTIQRTDGDFKLTLSEGWFLSKPKKCHFPEWF